MLTWLLKPARSHLSYACSDILVSYRVQVLTDGRDMNRLHGQKRLGRSRSLWSPFMVTENGSSGTGERQVVIPTLIVSPSMFSPS